MIHSLTTLTHKTPTRKVQTQCRKRMQSNSSRRTYTTTPPAYPNGFHENPFEHDLTKYHHVANATLSDLITKFDYLEDLDIAGFDTKEHDGVFEVSLGKKGAYVINKQSPNRQIWSSSPVSGAKRYNYDASVNQWRNTRDGHLLYDMLSEEVSMLFNVQFSLFKDPPM